MRKSLVVVQQYLSTKGHYRQYFENLLDDQFDPMYVADKKENYKNGYWIPRRYSTDMSSIISKIKGRFLYSFMAYRRLKNAEYAAIHLIEFEPLTFLVFSRSLNRRRLLLTIHSSDRLYFSSWINNKISGFQRWLFNIALKKAIMAGAEIVTHYECHKQSLAQIVGLQFLKQIHVVHYPAPEPESATVKETANLRSPRFLIYGQIREDKGIYEFLLHESTKRLQITIAGRISDSRILQFTGRENLTIVNKFLSSQEINELIESHDFMLLPYPVAYTNGAGTFKDSLAKAMPVVCSDIPIFREIVDNYGVGLIFSHPDEIYELTSKISATEYIGLSQNCLDYAYKFDWKYMRESYFRIYEEMLKYPKGATKTLAV